MTQKIWRLEIDALEPKGGAVIHIVGAADDNDPLDALLFFASTQSLAIIEGAVRLTLPREVRRRLVECSVPDDVWEAREKMDGDSGHGHSHLRGRRSLSMDLSSWSGSRRSAVLAVPCLMAPEERIVIVNRRHPDARRITARTVASGHYI